MARKKTGGKAGRKSHLEKKGEVERAGTGRLTLVKLGDKDEG